MSESPPKRWRTSFGPSGQRLQTNAGLYNGLYVGLERVRDKTAKKPEKILKEWHSRTVYKWEESPIAALCGETLAPAVENADPNACAKWAELLLNAAQAAGIVKETAEELVLDETTVRAYVEWDGGDLYVGDRVKILHPAWYQNGQVIKQGALPPALRRRCGMKTTKINTQGE